MRKIGAPRPQIVIPCHGRRYNCSVAKNASYAGTAEGIVEPIERKFGVRYHTIYIARLPRSLGLPYS